MFSSLPFHSTLSKTCWYTWYNYVVLRLNQNYSLTVFFWNGILNKTSKHSVRYTWSYYSHITVTINGNFSVWRICKIDCNNTLHGMSTFPKSIPTLSFMLSKACMYTDSQTFYCSLCGRNYTSQQLHVVVKLERLYHLRQSWSWNDCIT